MVLSINFQNLVPFVTGILGRGGIRKGIEQGIEEAKKEVVLEVFKEGLSIEVIS